MFDDPRKELRRMEAELLAAEQEEEQEQPGITDAEILYDLEEDDWLREAKELIGEAPAPQPREKRRGIRNDAVDFHRMAYADEVIDENTAVFVEKKKQKKQGKQEKKGLGCLPLVAALEIIAIGTLAWWWYRWLR